MGFKNKRDIEGAYLVCFDFYSVFGFVKGNFTSTNLVNFANE